MVKRIILVVLIVIALLILMLLGLALYNLSLPSEPSAELLARVEDPELEYLLPIYVVSCLDCHSRDVREPIYMGWPGAKQLIQHDMEEALEHFDMDRELFGAGVTPSEPALARVEEVLETGEMPPPIYVLMHWDACVSAENRALHHIWVRHTRARRDGAEDLDDPLYDRTIYPLRAPTDLDQARVDLGRQLYHDTRLSTDDSISCNSCHDLAKGGTDQERVSEGVGGQLGGINSPTTLNAVYNVAQFWDGRAADLVAQADGPPTNPVEMGSSWEEIVGKLQQDPEMVKAFAATYGELTGDTIKEAIATFERTLVTPDSRFDRYLQGAGNILTDEEEAGWRLFEAMGCDVCHAGAAMGGGSFEVMGHRKDYFEARGGELTDADKGRYNVTKDPHDAFRFKVPTLRNVALTFPYFHDGSAEDLEHAVRVMARYQLGRTLTEPQVARLVAFLRTLTGTLDGKPL
jgi:cytochrome c peroxidase